MDGRNLIDIFMVLPSKKDYPDYYHVISEPIDMSMIEAKIKADKVCTLRITINTQRAAPVCQVHHIVLN